MQPMDFSFIAVILNLFFLFSRSVVTANEDKSILRIDDQEWYDKKLLQHETGIFPSGRLHILRLEPNEDLIESLWRYARVTNIKAASILTCVGSLITTNIRYANDQNGTSLTGHFEITSLVGNIDLQTGDSNSSKGSGHVHITIADENGNAIGGHLLSGNIIYTTAEISLMEISGALFHRVLDEGPKGSGYKELKVFNLPSDTL